MKDCAELTAELLLFGFGIYSLFYFSVTFFLHKQNYVTITKYDNSACVVAAIAGGLYLLVWLIKLSMKILPTEEQDGVLIANSVTSPYWLGFLVPPLLLSSSQLLWIKSLRRKKIIRVIIALFLLTSIESIVIYLTALHRDYLPSSWSMPVSARITEWLIGLGLFGATTTIFHLMKTKLKAYTNQRKNSTRLF